MGTTKSMCPPSHKRKQTWAPWVHSTPSHWLQKQIWRKLHTLMPHSITLKEYDQGFTEYETIQAPEL